VQVLELRGQEELANNMFSAVSMAIVVLMSIPCEVAAL